MKDRIKALWLSLILSLTAVLNWLGDAMHRRIVVGLLVWGLLKFFRIDIDRDVVDNALELSAILGVAALSKKP